MNQHNQDNPLLPVAKNSSYSPVVHPIVSSYNLRPRSSRILAQRVQNNIEVPIPSTSSSRLNKPLSSLSVNIEKKVSGKGKSITKQKQIAPSPHKKAINSKSDSGTSTSGVQNLPVEKKNHRFRSNSEIQNTKKKLKTETNVELLSSQESMTRTPTMGPPLNNTANETFGLQDGEELRIIPSPSSSSNSLVYIGGSANNNSLDQTPSNQYNDGRTSLETVTQALEIMLTFETSSCSFCCEILAIGEGIILQDCCCTFCRTCLVTLIENSSSAEILCPHNSNCGGQLYHREIKAILPPESYKEYTKRIDDKVIGMMCNMFLCKTKDCPGRCEYQKDSKIFLCPECNKSNCLSCKAIHEGLECKDFQELLSTAIQEGKSWEEAEEFINSQLANGWEQFLGTVSKWMEVSPSMRNRSQDYSKILQKMANQDLWPSTREFECPICICVIPVGEGIILQDCLHTVCRECAVGLVEHAAEPEVKCPYQDRNYSCVAYLKPREIKALVTPELHETFLARSVQQAESAIPNSFHCKTPDCGGWCIFDVGVQVFKCQLCSKKNCLACEVIHESVSCEDYKNKLVQNTNDEISKKMLEELIQNGQCMRCPTCKIVAEKTQGCDWVVCLVCKTEICWATKGPRWGPKGNGDTTGGCKCKLNGKLCVPNCRNCH